MSTIFVACDKMTAGQWHDLQLSQCFKTCFKMLRHFFLMYTTIVNHVTGLSVVSHCRQACSAVIFQVRTSTCDLETSVNWAKNTAFFISCRNSCVNTSKEQSVLPLFWANLVQTKHCFGCASVTGIVKNVLGTSLLCHERSRNVAPLQPRLFVARWPNNTALLVQKKGTMQN